MRQIGIVFYTWTRDKAYQYVVEETHDLKDAKKLADSTRALAMLRRDHAEEFEKLVTQKESPKEETKTVVHKKPYNLIQLLEEKFGLKVEVCGNCNFCHLNLGKYYCEYNFSGKSIGQNIFDTCPYKSWVPKEISEKPSSA